MWGLPVKIMQISDFLYLGDVDSSVFPNLFDMTAIMCQLIPYVCSLEERQTYQISPSYWIPSFLSTLLAQSRIAGALLTQHQDSMGSSIPPLLSTHSLHLLLQDTIVMRSYYQVYNARLWAQLIYWTYINEDVATQRVSNPE